MASRNIVIEFVNRRFGVLQFVAGFSIFVTLFYCYKKRSNKVQKIADFHWVEVGRVKELYYYPLKSGRGKKVNSCDFTDFGISVTKNGVLTLKDRMFLVYSGKNGKFQTGRNYPSMLLVNIYPIDENTVRLGANGTTSVEFRLPETREEQSPDEVECSMWWGEPLKCIDCGSEPAQWISKFLTGNEDSELRIGMAVSKRRNILKGPWEKFTKVYKTLRNEDSGYFADLASYMLLNEASLGELNKRLERPISSLQLRPNIVVSGCESFAEDTWEWIKIGKHCVLRNVKPCPRCSMVRIDPETANVDKVEPLQTLRSFREQMDPERINVDGKAPTMGIYCGLYEAGSVEIGDEVYVRR